MSLIRRLVVLCALAVPLPALAAAPDPSTLDVMAQVRADRWPEAAAAAVRYADPIVSKLVTYYRLLAPNAASTQEIASFMATNPDWPQQASLARRRDEALAGEPDDTVLTAECGREAPRATAALLHCADRFTAIGRTEDAARMARRAWVSGVLDPAWEQRFLHEYGQRLTAADQTERFERIATQDMPPRQSEAGRQMDATLARQLARLPAGERKMAEARLALRRDDPTAPALLAGLGAVADSDPALFLDHATGLRRAGQDEAAVALWLAKGGAAEKAAGALRTTFWGERNLLSRRRLRQGDAAGAYALAAGHAQSNVEAAIDAEFLAGFIALRKLNDPTRALGHFQRLASLSGAAITQGRAWYWIGRAEDQAGFGPAARDAYLRAAAWPNSFYGQLAALRAGESPKVLAARITATSDPPVDPSRALDLAGRDLARAAAYLAGWGETRRAQTFLLRLDEIAPDHADRVLIARLATGLGMPETAIALARRAGRDGLILLDAGWPQPVSPPPAVSPEPALVLGIIRQESSFDTTTTSPVGARGLMQLMPATAAQTARKLGLAASIPALVLDPGYNMRLGSAYLRDLLDQLDATPLAVAAYNAGPGRVNEWIGTNGDPRLPDVDMIDWIEQIPFSETRNYVQRVIENQVIYRARRGETKPHPMVAWLK